MNESIIFNMGRGLPRTFELLWSNDSPSHFDTKDIEFPEYVMEMYTMFYVLWNTTGGVNSDHIRKSIIVNDTTLQQRLISQDGCHVVTNPDNGNEQTQNLYRPVTVTDVGLTIGNTDGYVLWRPITGENGYVMPLHIYGIR